MKACSSCGVVKGAAEYYVNKRSSDGRMYSCKDCKKASDSIKYQKRKAEGKIAEYRLNNASKISEYNTSYQKKYRSSGRKESRKLKMCLHLGGKCSYCSINVSEYNLAMFDFHHTNNETKEYDPSDMVNMSWERIESELRKCILLCSNCHRIHHHGTSAFDTISGWDDL